MNDWSQLVGAPDDSLLVILYVFIRTQGGQAG
jgi:hypothetical protein